MSTDYDWIHFHSQYSYPDPMLLVENSLFESSQGFQEVCFECHDPITEFLDQSYLERSIKNNRFQPFLMLAKKYNTNEDKFARIPRGLSSYYFQKKKKCKCEKWLEVLVMTYISIDC